MRILFAGISPSKELKKVLLANQITLEEIQKGKNPPKQEFDLVLLRFSKSPDSEILRKLKKDCLNSWFQLIIDEEALEDPKFYSLILENKDKNGFSFLKNWEATLWLTIDQMNQSENLKKQIRNQETEIQVLKNTVADLSKHSTGLVAQFEKNIHLAENIQRAMLPKFSPQIPGINISAKYIPAMGVGGDYYDIFEFGDKRRFGIILCDSQTHGMAAALLSILIKLRLEEMKDRFSDTSHFLQFLNREFHANYHKDISSLTLLYGIMDRVTLTFQYTVAGSLQPFLFRSTRTVPVPRSSAPPLGEMDHFTFQEHKITLKPGDSLLLHTDGLNDILEGDPAAYLSKHLFSKDAAPDPLVIQNTIMGKLDQFTSKTPLKQDITFLHFFIDERAMYLAKQH